MKVLPPHKPIMPTMPPGMLVSVAPAGHYLWLEDYEYYDQLGRDPLQREEIWAIPDDDERVTRLKALLDEYPKSKHRRKMLFKAARRGDSAIVQCLVDTGLEVHPDIQQAQKDQESGEQESDADHEEIIDRPDPDDAPLHVAANQGKLDCLKIMVESGVDINARDEFGRTPLGAACSPGYKEMVRYLLEKGADPTARLNADLSITKKYFGQYAGADALELAAPCGDVELLLMLLDHPQSRYCEHNESRDLVSPLAIRSAAGTNVDALKLLLARGGYPIEYKDGKLKGGPLNQEQKEVITRATNMAAQEGDLASLKLLFSYTYPVDPTGEPSPVIIPESMHRVVVYGMYNAIKDNQIDKFEYLHSFGIKEHDSMSLDDLPEGQTINIQHLLDVAAEAGAIEGVKHLIEKYDAKPDVHRIPSGCRPIWAATASDKSDMVRYLLENHSIDLHVGNGRYSSGITALWTAISLKSLESAKLLLQHGGPVDHIDEEIKDVKEPMVVILRALFGDASERPTVRLETESSAKKFVDGVTSDFMDMNPMYLRLEIGPEDKDWIEKLEMRRAKEELKETGEFARELSRAEAMKKSEFDAEDPRRVMVALPTIDKRIKKLKNDDDRIPEFKSFLKSPRADDEDEYS